MDAEKKIKDEKVQVIIVYKNKLKELIEIATFKLPGTNYDKFWVDSLKTKLSSTAKVQPVIDFLQSCDGDVIETLNRFKPFIEEYFMNDDEKI